MVHNDVMPPTATDEQHANGTLPRRSIMYELAQADRHGKISMLQLPTYPSREAERTAKLESLAQAFRLFGKSVWAKGNCLMVLGKRNLGEGAAGHISIRTMIQDVISH